MLPYSAVREAAGSGRAAAGFFFRHLLGGGRSWFLGQSGAGMPDGHREFRAWSEP